LTAKETEKIVKKNFNLSETIFAVAGKYDFDAVAGQIEKLFEADTIFVSASFFAPAKMWNKRSRCQGIRLGQHLKMNIICLVQFRGEILGR